MKKKRLPWDLEAKNRVSDGEEIKIRVLV